MTSTTRAIDDDKKQARKTTLLRSGWLLFMENNGQMPSVSQIAKHAGIGKGTFYLYFQTKEELFLELLADAVDRFFERMRHTIGEGAIDIPSIVEEFVDTIAADEALTRLGCLMQGVIEQNTEAEVLIKFKMRMVKQLFELGNMVSHGVSIAVGEGKPYRTIKNREATRLMLRSYAIFVGVAQLIQPENSAAKEIPEFDPVILELKKDTQAMILALWRDTLRSKLRR